MTHTAPRHKFPLPLAPLQVSSAAALSKGDLVAALDLSRQASALEVAAELLMLPSSTTLFFIPGTAFHGVVALRIAAAAAIRTTSSAPLLGLGGATVRSLLKEASASFDACLLGRPNLSACLLGSARAHSALGEKKAARAAYAQLLAGWQAVKGGVPAKQSCKKAWKEAQAYASG